MFVARRKLLWVISVLMLFVVVATVNHYLYLEPSTKVMPHTGEVSVEKHTAPIMVERKSFKPGEDEILGDDDDHAAARPTELSVQEEVNKNLRTKRIEYVRKMELKLAAEEQMQLVTTEETNKNKDLMDDDDDEKTPDVNSDGTRYIPRRRVVHLDLKGAPPKISYFKSLFPLLKEAGATTILLEYEDMFPFWGELRNLSALNAYSEKEVKTLLGLAAASGLEVIPLVQTFGHLEFALKQEEYRDLREVPYYPQALCPSRERSWSLITQMVDQVLSFHPDARWLHVGCDEVFQLGQCPLCQRKISEANIAAEKEDVSQKQQRYHDSRSLFLDHIHRVASYVRQKKKVTPIVWDDMLRGIPEDTLLQSGIGPLVEPMVWVYVEDVDRFVDPLAWATFGSVFRHVWTAGAFKGAFGERLYSANVERHVGNNLAWLEVMRRESKRLSFRGIVLTGWSRYDHFAVLCELLPAAVPSLVLNLVVLREGAHDATAARTTHRLLQCSHAKALMTAEELLRNPEQWDLQRCKFPGSELFGLLASFDMSRRETEAVYDKLTKKDGWMTEYNVRHRFSSAQRVSDAMRGVSYLPTSLRSLRAQLAETLARYFDGHTVDEWLEQNLQPLEAMVEELNGRFKLLTAESAWPRRPLLSAVDEVTQTEEQ